jgi:hypothetical protein
MLMRQSASATYSKRAHTKAQVQRAGRTPHLLCDLLQRVEQLQDLAVLGMGSLVDDPADMNTHNQKRRLQSYTHSI